MTTAIVERLRHTASFELNKEAADEIERLRADLMIAGEKFAEACDENERLRAELDHVAITDAMQMEQLRAENDQLRDQWQAALIDANILRDKLQQK